MGSLIKTGKGEPGFTLIELLIAIIVTSIISIPVVRVLIDSSNNLQRAANEAAYNMQVIDFTKIIQNDINDSQDTFIFDENIPISNENLCTQATSLTWPTSSNEFTRPLFSIYKYEVKYEKKSNISPDFRNLEKLWVGYDIKKVPNAINGLKNAYEIWRNECGESGSTPASSRPILSIGNVLCINSLAGSEVFQGIGNKNEIGKSNCMSSTIQSNELVNLSLTGKFIFSCIGSGILSCPINSSTRSIYKFDILLPISACSPPILATLNSISNCPTPAGTSRLPNPLANLGREFIN